MILIDSSVWIAFFNGREGNAVSVMERLIDAEEEVHLSEYILTEVLQGFRKDREYEAARRSLLRFPIARLRARTPILKRPKFIESAGSRESPGGMGGKETMKELLLIDSHVKVIVSSGYSSDPIMSDFKQYGFRDVIAKPYRLEELEEVIERVIVEG